MNKNILEIENLSIKYHGSNTKAVNYFNMTVGKGETIGIVGESGSGKSSIANAIMGLLHDKAEIQGYMKFNGENFLWNEKNHWEKVRWNKISLVFQNSINVLNPMMKIIRQVSEPITRHLKYSKENARNRASILLEEVGLDKLWWEAYPNQLSGGMRQKVLIAMALACKPELLIVDEPTMSLDPQSKKQITELLKNLQEQYNFGLIVISHEMNIIKELCSNIHVLYKGYHLEHGKTFEVFENPKHPYSKGLIGASWELDSYRDIWGIPSSLREKKGNGCPFYKRCFQARESCQNFIPNPLDIKKGHVVSCCRGGISTLLNVENVSKKYFIGKTVVPAVSKVSFDVKEGEVLTVIGVSGSGKSTLASLISGFEEKDEGSIKFKNREIAPYNIMRNENGIQLVVQDPSSAMNPDWTVLEVLYEPIKWNLKLCDKKSSKLIRRILENVELPTKDSFLGSKVGILSGGEKQRIAIGRALIMNPKLLIADEVTAMLDPSNAANLVNMLKDMQNRFGFSMIYITHDLYLARKISDRTILLDKGKIEYYGPSAGIIDEKLIALRNYSISKEKRVQAI